MKAAVPVLALFASLLAVCASNHHDSRSRHSRFMQRSNTLVGKNITKRCKSRSNPAPTPAPSQPKPSHNSSAAGLIPTVDNACGPSGATKVITKTTGPNGSIDWLNCGINSGGGWNPPNIQMSDIVHVPLSDAIKSPQTPFKPCLGFINLFEKYGAIYGISPIILVSIAMQESDCNKDEVGGAGEQGIMQITKDKCGGAPGGDCKNLDFNIKTGAKYFALTLKANNGNVLATLGTYNGWHKHLTFAQATAAGNSPCCTCQNNLDYLHQTCNGWLQNIDPRARNMGKYFNLNKCANNI